MPILLDGNNLLHALSPSERSRSAVRRLVLEAARHERMAVTVVFDGPPPAGAPAEEVLGLVRVVYAGSRTADEVIVGRIPDGRAASQWSVVTDDRGLAARARDRGATTRTLSDWQQRPRTALPARPRAEPKLSAREVAEWEAYFKDGDNH